MSEDHMHYDVVIIGAGPSGLSAAIRLKQLSQKNGKTLSVCILEKGSEVGAHILAGAVLEPHSLEQLLPDWQTLNPPPFTAVTQDEFIYLTAQKSFKLPTPRQMKNHGNYIISLGSVCKWLAEVAENMGVEIYPGFPAATLIYDGDQVVGIKTKEMGINKQSQRKANYEPPMEIYTNQLILAEGCRGHLTEEVIRRYQLRVNAPQTYAIGFKELWRVNPEHHQLGKVTHSIGWPLNPKTYGGSFIYHAHDNLIALGFAIGLDYQNPYLNPYLCFQQFKQHPKIKPLLEGGQILSYGARALNEGGWQSLPKLCFPGGVIIGCAAGFLNVPKIKGIHTAMGSGWIAAEAIFEALSNQQPRNNYQSQIDQSWIAKELRSVRNIRPGFKWGLIPGLINAAFETYITHGKSPWTLAYETDHSMLKPAQQFKPIDYPKPDGIISFDKLTNVARSGVFHEEDQPCHLKITKSDIPNKINYTIYQGPEQRYCPAGVYEYHKSSTGEIQFTINAQNCIHCKTCDIKDPTQNIKWTPPEGGGGPNYVGM